MIDDLSLAESSKQLLSLSWKTSWAAVTIEIPRIIFMNDEAPRKPNLFSFFFIYRKG
jgi:hypothetical protein